MNLKKELPLIAIVLLPFIYLAYLWNDLPSKVPMHWNLKGEIDRYGDKSELIIIPILLPLLVYVIFLVVPKIDPKNKLNKMGDKLQTIKFLLTTYHNHLNSKDLDVVAVAAKILAERAKELEKRKLGN